MMRFDKSIQTGANLTRFTFPNDWVFSLAEAGNGLVHCMAWHSQHDERGHGPCEAYAEEALAFMNSIAARPNGSAKAERSAA